jgi:hypothetical protein
MTANYLAEKVKVKYTTVCIQICKHMNPIIGQLYAWYHTFKLRKQWSVYPFRAVLKMNKDHLTRKEHFFERTKKIERFQETNISAFLMYLAKIYQKSSLQTQNKQISVVENNSSHFPQLF